MSQVFVQNEAARPIVIGLKPDPIRLVSGVNQVDEEAWEAAKKIAVVQTYLNEGTLREPSKAKTEGDTLKGVSSHESLTLIKETFDPRILARWEEGEKRPPVLKAIEEQRQAIEKATRPKDDKAKE